MIIIRLNGGLGNQMFQYAFGKSLAMQKNTLLKLDIRWYKKGIRNYELYYFNVQEPIATEEEIKLITKMTTSFTHRWQRNIIQPLMPYYSKYVLEEQSNYFDEDVFKARNNVYIKGYWQSEKYFQGIENTVREAFTHKYELDSKNKEISEILQACNSVSVHVRRGDYITNPEYAFKYGSCTVDYYKRAHQALSKKLENPQYFIFSDDPDWAHNNLTFFKPSCFVNHNQAKDSYKDLFLMSLCKHNIIANSSFSWWAAWLNSNQSKQVIAPKKWFNDASAVNKDLIPDSWIQL